MSGVSGPPSTPGGSQIAAGAIRFAMEIDQALKLLGQQLPSLAPWVDQTVQQLRQQVGQALAQGVNASPQPGNTANFPGGASNL
jgi:hypothetical protein